jgi:hypothetical protein
VGVADGEACCWGHSQQIHPERCERR